MSVFTRKPNEPIRWVYPTEMLGRYASPEKNFSANVLGTERKPLLAHVGWYDDPKEHPLARARRYIDVVRHDGHTVSLVLTCASGDIENGEYAAFMKAKARHFGWFPVDECVVRLIKARLFKPDVIAAKELLEARVCPKGKGNCEHNVVERNARIAQQKRAMQTLDDETTNRELRQQRAIAEASAQGIAAALAPILADLVGKTKR